MIQLTDADIQLNAHVTNKEEAIRQAGRVLVEAGHIEPGYVTSMLGREQQANTYLGNGIAIPHGMPKDRELIRRTGISVVQVPGGVTWNQGETVHLIVGIAARSDEHLGILANLTGVLSDPATVQRLAQTRDPAEIIASLNGAPADNGHAAPDSDDFQGAQAVEVPIAGHAGLHARPATAFVDLASQFNSEIRVQLNGKTANGKALAALLRLGAESGQTIRILARGPDASAALQALRAAVASGLGDQDEPQPQTESRTWTPVSTGRSIAGVAASPGLAIGPLYQMRRSRVAVADVREDPASAEQRLVEALRAAHGQLDQLHSEVKGRSGSSEAAIFRAHQAFLDDPELLADVRAEIGRGHGAAWAWNSAIETRVAELRGLRDERLAARAVDLQDVGQRVLRLLTGTAEAAPAQPEHPVIVIAEDLTPSDTASLDPRRTLGLCTALGGPTSHTAIIARSLDIPALVGAGPALLELPDGGTAIIDGGAGQLYLEPSAADLESARAMQAEQRGQRDVEFSTRFQPALLRDGHRIEVVANIGKAAEAAEAVNQGAEGVGLMRTEFLFIGRATPPDEEEQYAAYTEMTRALNGLPLIIRTLDIGGDKEAPYLGLPAEANPFLGVRGIRLSLNYPELFTPQLRAIYRASTTGPIKIMFPMIATLEDLRAAKAAAEQVRRELGVAPIEIGMMVEVPSSVVLADLFAAEVDFFSIGTNDLTQYTLAIDRLHPTLGKQVDGLHPAVLRMIAAVTRAADTAGRWVGVCGGIAGDPRGALILAGLGVTELSMSLPSIPEVKAGLRQVSLTQAQAVAQRALACATATEVRQLALPAASR